MDDEIAKGRRELRKWRKSQTPRMTQDALGRDVGVSGSAIRHFENGSNGFDLSLLVKVKLSRRTGLALGMLTSAVEIQLAKDLVVIMARDAAA